MNNTPRRSFDICIASLEALTLPAVLRDAGVRFCQISVGDAFDSLPKFNRFSEATYLRLALPQALGTDYDRILYLDSDTIVAGDAMASVFDLDLGTTPLGAVLDNVKWKFPRKPTPDQAALGINGAYFNSGVLLMDCREFLRQQIFTRCLEVGRQIDPKIIHMDQTLLNLALRDNWTALHPAWNWQWSIVRPLFEALIDVQVVHFIGPRKPWADPRAQLPLRYRQSALRFLKRHFPDAITVDQPAEVSRGRLMVQLLKHIGRAPAIVRLLRHYGPDITLVRPPGRI